MASWFRKAFRAAKGLAHVAKPFASLVPGVGAAIAAYDVYDTARSAVSSFTGGGGGGVPSLPALPAPARLAAPMPAAGAAGSAPIFAQPLATGSRGVRTMSPINWDINTINQLEQMGLMIGHNKLHTAARSPVKTHVVVHPVSSDGTVLTFALEKKFAHRLGLWKPAHKPPIKVGEWHAVKKAAHMRKKLVHIEKVYNHAAKPLHKTHHHPALPAPKKR